MSALGESEKAKLGLLMASDDWGRKRYRCRICGNEDYWKEGWIWWGSDRDMDDGVEPFVQCPKHPVDGRGPHAAVESPSRER